MSAHLLRYDRPLPQTPGSPWTAQLGHSAASPGPAVRARASTPPRNAPRPAPVAPAAAVRPRRSCCSTFCRRALQAAFFAVVAGLAVKLQEEGHLLGTPWRLAATDSSCQGPWLWADQTLEGCQAQADEIDAAHLTYVEQTGYCKFARGDCELSGSAAGQRVYYRVTLKEAIELALARCGEVLTAWAAECVVAAREIVTLVSNHLAEAAPEQWAKWFPARDDAPTLHVSVQDLAAHFDLRFTQIDKKLNEQITEVLRSSALQPDMMPEQIRDLHASVRQSETKLAEDIKLQNDRFANIFQQQSQQNEDAHIIKSSVAMTSAQIENMHNSLLQSAGSFESQYRQLAAILEQERQAHAVGEQVRRADLLAEQDTMRSVIQAAEARFGELLVRIAELEGKTLHTIETRVADAVAQLTTFAAAERAERQAALAERRFALEHDAIPPHLLSIDFTMPEPNNESCLLSDPSLFIHQEHATPETVLGVELESVKCLVHSFEEALAQDALAQDALAQALAQDGSDAKAVPAPSVPQEPACVNTSSPVVASWRYQPSNGMKMRLRAEPSIDGAVTDQFLELGEVFMVTEEVTRSGEPGVLFLRLADGHGWAFDVMPHQGVMCVRVHGGDGARPAARPLGDARSASCADHPVCASSGLQGLCCPTQEGVRVGCCAPALARKWRYSPPNQQLLRLRREPALDAELSGEDLSPHEVFHVSEEVPMQVPEDYLEPGDDGSVLFLRLSDGRGWAFDRRPDRGVMCVPASDVTSPASSAACEVHSACRGLHGQCCPTEEGLMLGCCR